MAKMNLENLKLGDLLKVRVLKKGIDIDKLDLKRPVVFQGFAGIGNVGLVAVDYMATKLKARPILQIPNLDIPAVALVEDGVFANWFDSFSIFLHLMRGDNRDYLFVSSYTQPFTPLGSNLIAHILLHLMQKLSVETIISLGCFGATHYVKSPKVYVSATNKKLLEDFLSIENVVPLRGGRISGLNGTIPLLAPQYGIEGVSLLAEGHSGITFNPRSSKAIIDVLCAKYGLKVDTSFLEKHAEKMEKEIKKEEAVPPEIMRRIMTSLRDEREREPTETYYT
ncbi:MAG: PAC2 family protein [Candidatus Jordarchaeales archaeon]